MHLRIIIQTLMALVVFSSGNGLAAPHEITIQEALTRAAQVSPEVAGSRMKDVAAQDRIEVARAGYFPKVDLEALDSTGFPGSTGHLGVAGMVSSPYRSGAAAGIVTTVPIWDFGRTSNAVTAAEHSALSQKEDTNYLRYRVYQTTLQIYYQCSLYRNLRESWTQLAEGARLVKNMVDGFVKTGQRSIVERYLVESQMEHALTQVSIFEEKAKQQIKEIALITGLDSEDLTCPGIPSEENAIAIFHGTPEGNPIVSRAREAVVAARSKVDEAKADYLPRVVGVADAAVMQNTRFVDKNYYALGVAVIFPLFEGFITTNKVKEASALATGAERELEARKLEMAQLNIQYDKIIQSSKVALTHLKDESQLAQQGFEMAKKRFFSLEGSVVDVRDAFTNLSRTQTDLITTQTSYFEAMGAKAILNGTPF